ncbi:MAG: hypothetical protein M0Z66_13990 [Thermaerobacter sp.]|nr:hypothetical protein [Thermaerobacter sp.]
MITTAELLQALEERGYHISPRRLIDWDAKGLLPPSARPGRGQRRGRAHLWPDTAVEQAALVADMLEVHRRVPYLYVPLWLLGADIDLRLVRQHLWKSLSSVDFFYDLRSEAMAGAQDAEDFKDELSRLAVQLASKGQRACDRTTDAEEVEIALGTMLDPDYQPTNDLLRRLLARSGQPNASPKQLRPIFKFLQKDLALATLRDRIRRASDGDWHRARVAWQRGYTALQQLGALAGLSRPEWRPLALRFVIQLGPAALVFLFGLQLNGRAFLVERWTASLEEFVDDVRREPDALRPFATFLVPRAERLASGASPLPWGPRFRRNS